MGNIKDKLSEIVITYYSDFQGFHEDILHTQEVASYKIGRASCRERV